MKQLPVHDIYKVVENKKDAEAIAYVFIDQGPPVQYPFKFPELKEDEVRIQVTYTGLCQTDCSTVRQKWWNVKLPCCPGHEIVGIVELIGSKVIKFKPGDRVGCNFLRNFCEKCEFCLKGQETCCVNRVWIYDPYFGGFSTHVQIPARSIYKLPENFKDELGAPLFCAGITVFAPIMRNYNPNLKVAVIGIGGLGHLALQFCAKMGMDVTAFTTSFNRKEDFHKLGASQISSSIDLKSLKEEEGKYDMVINTLHVGDGKVFTAHMKLTKPRGVYIQVGIPNYQTKMIIDMDYITQNEIKLQGSIIGTPSEQNEMNYFCAEHNIYPIVETFKFEDFPAAFEKLEHGRPRFRCVVNIKDWAQANGVHKPIMQVQN